MATVKDFEELRIWQDARVLSKEIYAITGNEAFVQNKMYLRISLNSKFYQLFKENR